MPDSHYLPASSSAATLVETASDTDAHSYPPSLSLSKHVPTPLSTTAHSEMDFSSYRRSPSWRNGESVDRGGARTPSPTPSERRALKQKGMRMVDMQAMKTVEYWRQPRHIVMAFLALFGGVIGILFIVYDKSIIRTLHPATKWMHDLPAGWLIPIAILFVISFPPLFGHEIIAVLCGIVWGVGEGFAIVAAGTILGELGNFYVFKYSFRAYAEKQEKEKIFYACLARVVREGGFKIALISRYSVIPGHITTAIYATCGLNVFIFLAAAILSLPKQIMLILLGVLADSGVAEDNAKPVPKYEKYLSGVSIALTTVLTLLAWFYLMREIERVKSQVIYERRKARQAPMSELTHGSVSMTTLSVHSGRELEEGPIL